MKRSHWDEETQEAFRLAYIDPYGGPSSTVFDDVEPALRFGWNRALASEYPNETWEEVEEDLERAWLEAPRPSEWAEIKQHVRDAWEKARADWKGLASKVKSQLAS